MNIYINTRTGLYIINLNDVVFLKADGNYTQFYYADGRVRVEISPLSHYETVIGKAYADAGSESPFFRANRSLMVNIDAIRAVTLNTGVLSFQSDKVRTITCTKETLRVIRDHIIERYHIEE